MIFTVAILAAKLAAIVRAILAVRFAAATARYLLAYRTKVMRLTSIRGDAEEQAVWIIDISQGSA